MGSLTLATREVFGDGAAARFCNGTNGSCTRLDEPGVARLQGRPTVGTRGEAVRRDRERSGEARSCTAARGEVERRRGRGSVHDGRGGINEAVDSLSVGSQASCNAGLGGGAYVTAVLVATLGLKVALLLP